MKLDGYKIISAGHGIEAWIHAEAEVPLDTVLRRRLASVAGDGRAQLMESGRWRRSGPPRNRDAIMLSSGPIAFMMPSGEEISGQGVIIGDDEEALIDFLTERYRPVAEGEIECLIRRLRAERAPRRAVRAQLREALRPGRRSPGLRMRHRSGPSSPAARLAYLRSMRTSPRSTGSPVIADRDETDAFERIELPEGLHAFVAASSGIVLRCDVVVFVRGTAVPRTNFLHVAGDAEDPLLWWDGRAMRRLRSLAEAPEEVLAMIERTGNSVTDVPGAWAGAPELRPLFVMRIRPEVVRNLERTPRVENTPPPHPVLRNATFLFDTKTTVPLAGRDGSEPVIIDDDAAAVFVLERALRRGSIYLPTVPARPFVRNAARTNIAHGAGDGELTWTSPRGWLGEMTTDRWLVGALPEV